MEAKIGEKGRITLPLEIRKSMGVMEGDVVIIEPRGNEVVLRPKHRLTVKEVKGIAKVGKVKLEEIEEALGKE